MEALTFDDLGAAPQPQYGKAIAATESGGRYDAMGPVTRTGDRAYGKYQVMGANIPVWTKEVLGQSLTPEQYIANPQVQDAVFNAKFGNYVKKYGPEGAARAWFAGEGGMNDPGRRDVLGTSVAEYASKFTNNMGPGQAQAAPAATPVIRAAAPSSNALTFDDIGQTGPMQPDKGALNAAARGAATGLTLNFYDEMRGLSEAGGVAPDKPGNLGNLIVGGIKYAAGNPEAVRRYNEAVARERAQTKLVEQQHPVAYTGGNVAGSLVLPVGAGAQAATLPGRIAQGVALGSVLGGVAGVGEGEGAVDSTARGITGAGLGAVVGGATPVAVESVIRGGRAIATPIANAVRGLRDPEAEAGRRVTTALARDIAADPGATTRLTPQEFVANSQGGGPATIMDIGGDTTRALARSAANTSTEGRGALNRTINDRFEGQAGRVTDWLNQSFHFPNAQAQQAALDQTAAQVNKAGYGAAFRDGLSGIWDKDLYELSQAPALKDAVNAAIRQAQNRAAPDVSQGAAISQRWITKDDKPTLEFWDLVKRQIDQEINVGKRAGRNEDVMELTRIKSTLVQKLDDAVPSYAKARQGAAHFFGAENALEAGQNFVTANLQNPEVRQQLAKMSPTERQLFQDGFVSRFTEALNKTGDRRNVLNQIANSPQAREKLQLALGPQKAGELEAGLRAEGIMDLARGVVQGNSTTARQLVELGLAGGAGLAGNGLDFSNVKPSALMSAALVYGAARGHGRINENVARRVAEMLTSNDPRMILRGAQVVARNQNMLNSLRTLDQRLVRVGGNQSPVGVPALSAASVGRADQDQQGVPRPPGQ